MRERWLPPKTMLLGLSILYMVTPILVAGVMTLSAGRFFGFPPGSLSTRWYLIFFTDNSWLESIVVSVVIALGSATMALLLGLPAAFGIVMLPARARSALLGLICAPLLVPLIVIASGSYMFLSMLHLTDTYPGIIIPHTLLGTPFVVISTLSSLMSVDPALTLAARNAGASVAQAVCRIKLPLCRTGILTGFGLAALNSLNEVVIVLFLSGENVTPLSAKMWEGFRYEASPTIAIAATVMITIAFSLVLASTFLRPNSVTLRSWRS